MRYKVGHHGTAPLYLPDDDERAASGGDDMRKAGSASYHGTVYPAVLVPSTR